MATMVEEGIFQQIKIYDYQAVCFKGDDTVNDAISSRVVRHNNTQKPRRSKITHFQREHILGWVFDWMVSRLLWLYVQTSLQDIWQFSWAFVTEEGTLVNTIVEKIVPNVISKSQLMTLTRKIQQNQESPGVEIRDPRAKCSSTEQGRCPATSTWTCINSL